jgi:Zn-dependent peptidase ImmA (M78 family)
MSRLEATNNTDRIFADCVKFEWDFIETRIDYFAEYLYSRQANIYINNLGGNCT